MNRPASRSVGGGIVFNLNRVGLPCWRLGRTYLSTEIIFRWGRSQNIPFVRSQLRYTTSIFTCWGYSVNESENQTQRRRIRRTLLEVMPPRPRPICTCTINHGNGRGHSMQCISDYFVGSSFFVLGYSFFFRRDCTCNLDRIREITIEPPPGRYGP